MIALAYMVWFNEGNQFFRESKYDQAIESWEKALNIGKQEGNDQVISKCLMNIGTALSAKGDWNSALKYYKQSLELEKKRVDLPGTAEALLNIGDTLFALEKWEDARAYYEQSLETDEGNEANQARIHLNIGLTLLSEGKWNGAIESYQKSAELFKEIGEKSGLSKCLVNLGIAFRNLGKWEEAIRYYEQSLAIDQELDDQSGIAICLMNIGIALEAVGKIKEAIARYQQSLTIFKELGNEQAIASCLLNLGNAFEILKKWDRAVEFYQNSQKIFEKLDDKSNVSKCLTNIGIALRNLGHWEEAIKNYHVGLNWFEKLKDQAAISKCLLDLGVAYFSVNNWDEAINYLQQSRVLFQQLNDRPGEALACQNLGWGYQNHHEVKLALKYFTEALGIYNTLLLQINTEEYRQSYAQEFAELPEIIKSLNILLSKESEGLKPEGIPSEAIEEDSDVMNQLLTQLRDNITKLNNTIQDQAGLQIDENISTLKSLVDKTLLTFSASEKLKTDQFNQKILSSIELCNQFFKLYDQCCQDSMASDLTSSINLILSKMQTSFSELDIIKAIQDKAEQITAIFQQSDTNPAPALLEFKFQILNWIRQLFSIATSNTKLFLETIGKADEKASRKFKSELNSISKRLNEEEMKYSKQILSYLIITKKDSGLPIYQMNFITAKFDGDLVSGFLSAIQTFGSEIIQEKTTMEKLAYKDFKFFFQDGQYIRCALILHGEITEILFKRLKNFVVEFERIYHSLLIKETANIALFSKIDSLIKKIFELKD